MSIAFRPLRRADFPLLARWQARPHVSRWWREAADLATITEKYAPRVEGREATEVFVIELGGAPVGIIQRYRMADHPGWAAAVGFGDSAGIDYYLGEEGSIGRGVGSGAIAPFAHLTLARYPEVPMVIAAPQQANVASWRALEKAGFERLWAGQPRSDHPSDAGPAYVYGLRRTPSEDRTTEAASGARPARSIVSAGGMAIVAHDNPHEAGFWQKPAKLSRSICPKAE